MRTCKRVFSLFLVVLILCAAGFTAIAEQANDHSSFAETTLAKVAAKKITISGSKYVAKGKKVRLKAAVSPAKASQKVTWKSSDKKIATVSSKGVVKGIKAGTVKITATSKTNPKVTATWKMTVAAKPVKKIRIKAPATELDLGGKAKMTLKAKVSPSGAAQAVTWSSSKPAVAKVSSRGKVTALSKGSTVITAKAVDGSGVKAKITVTVIDSSEPVEPENPNPGEVYVTAHHDNKFTFFMYYPELQETYALNKPETYMNEVDFLLGFSVKDENNIYTVWTKHNKDSETQQNVSLPQMVSEICLVDQSQDSFDTIGSAQLAVNGKKVSWTVTFPDGFKPENASFSYVYILYDGKEHGGPVEKPLL